MKKGLVLSLVATAALSLPAVIMAQQGTALERTERAGWDCIDLGLIHCFDPGDAHSNNSASINVKVFDDKGALLGTEQLWRADLYAGQPCPQDELIDLGDFIACHHYSHG